jgi:hypothetical protein
MRYESRAMPQFKARPGCMAEQQTEGLPVFDSLI